MTPSQRHRATTTRYATVFGAAAAIAFGALLQAGAAGAEPPVPTPAPGEPVPPGQPVMIQDVEGGDAPPAPPPVGAPPVPEMLNPGYGQSNSGGGGLFGSLRDAYHQAKDPFNYADTPEGAFPGAAPPPGAGPPPALPPGFVSVNAPGSETIAAPKDPTQGPALPPGYYSLDGPPPPEGYYDNPPPAGAVAGAPPAEGAPPAYVPRHSPPPPPLYPDGPPPPPAGFG